MDPSDSIEQARQVGLHISDYIKFADAKAGLILTFVAAVGALVGVTAPAALAASKDAHVLAAMILVGAHVATAVSVAAVLWYTIAAIHPRGDYAHGSIVSFPDIARMKPSEYVDKITQASAAELLRNCALHNATLASIAVAKFASISRAMTWARVALFAAYVAALTFGIASVVRAA
ncbi:MAG TPA: Pycsar system effector family protein [Polyangiaceae bacterium]|nr:Pycsar system effector family protein [Polyangiaceae bacterium]